MLNSPKLFLAEADFTRSFDLRMDFCDYSVSTADADLQCLSSLRLFYCVLRSLQQQRPPGASDAGRVVESVPSQEDFVES